MTALDAYSLLRRHIGGPRGRSESCARCVEDRSICPSGCCNIVSAIAEPGHIKHWAANPPYITFGEFLGAATPKTLQVKAILDAAPGMDGNLEEDALAKIWEKFTFICSTTSVQAITGPHATQDMIPAIPELLDTWRAAMHEIVALCHSYGIKYDLKQVDQRVEADVGVWRVWRLPVP